MNEEETETDAGEYEPLFNVPANRAERLRRPENIALMAMMKTDKPALFERLMRKLSEARVPGLRDVRREVDSFIRRTERALKAGPATPQPEAPSMLTLAGQFRDEVHPTLKWHQHDWLLWRGAHYDDVEPDLVRRDAYRFLEELGGKPDARKVSDLLDALKGVALVERGTFDPPCWLDDSHANYAAKDMLSCANGLLHLPTGTLLEQTPAFFVRNSVPCAYDPDAPTPKAFLKFLDDLWGDDPEQIDLLQEIFGYLLTGDTAQQKLFLWLGATRGGKGTLLRIVGQLIGTGNICSPTLQQLGTRFGLETTLGKTVAQIADMRLPANRHSDRSGLIGNLLRIVGEDAVTVERKFRSAITTRLPLRVVIVSNKPPHLPDASGALAARLVALRFTKSFVGREDKDLDDKLAAELPGILLWAVEGWRRLKRQGRFTVTAASRETVEMVAEIATPIRAFLRECCELTADAITPKSDLWQRFQQFMVDRELQVLPSSPGEFYAELDEATGYALKETRPDTPDRARSWAGIRLRTDFDDTTPGVLPPQTGL